MKPLKIALKFLDIFYHEENIELLRELLHYDLVFEGPLYEFTSAEDYLESLKQDPPRGMDYRILKSFADESSVCLYYEFTKSDGDHPVVRTPMAQLFDIEEGKIRRIRLVFDTAALESHEVVLVSDVDALGNDEIMRMKIFAEFKTVNNRSYQPLNEATLKRLPGKYESGYLGIHNEEPTSWDDIELKADGTVEPGNHICRWQYDSGNVITMDYPYEAMPDFHLDAGIEQHQHYVFVEDGGRSMILANGDASVKIIYERLS